MNWMILYGDGSTFSDEQGSWTDAPGRDVQFIIFLDDKTGWTLRHGGDFFRMGENGQPVNMDIFGMVDHVTHELGIIKQGKMLETERWDALYRRALLVRAQLQEGA